MKVKLNIQKQAVISNEKADRLLERYYEGATSVKEENQLRKFLLQPNLPERFEVEKELFGYFISKKEKRTIAFTPAIKWAAAVAIVAVVISGGILFYANPAETSYAYRDGEKITDVDILKSLAYDSFRNITSENKEVEDNLNSIQNNELIQSQLEIFSEIEF